jgi:hypothetical protein
MDTAPRLLHAPRHSVYGTKRRRHGRHGADQTFQRGEPNWNTNAYTNSDWNSYRNTNSDRNINANCNDNADCHPDANTNTNGNADADTNGNADADSHSKWPIGDFLHVD